MRITRNVLVGLALIPALALNATAQAAAPEALYQRALAAERGAGDLQTAILLYKQVAAAGDRALAARALVRLGEAYEKLGSREARSAYERVVRDYADQNESVNIARNRLAGLTTTRTASAPTPAPSLTLLYAELPRLRLRDTPQFDFSPAGDEIVMRRPRNDRDALLGAALEIVNSGGTLSRTLVAAAREVGINSPRWSPDGEYIAFVRRAFVGSDTSFAELMVVPAAGGTPRRLISDAALAIPNPTRGGLFWTPDSKGLTVSTARGLVTVDLQGNVVRTAPMELRHLQHVIGYSPDGRWIVYDRVNDDSEQHDETDIWLVPAGGGDRIQLTNAPGLDSWPAWGDSRTIYFVSDRSGHSNVWRLEIDPTSGRPVGEPVQMTHYTDAMILYPRVVDGGRRLTFAIMREMSAVHAGSPDDIGSTRAVARGVQPQLSPDGKTVYYVSQGEHPFGIFAVPVGGGRSRRLVTGRPGGIFFTAFAVSGDGHSLAYFAREGTQTALYTVPTAGGTPTEIIRLEGKEHLVPAWSPDSRRLAYSHRDGLYVIPATGGPPEKIATTRGWDGWSVRWSPDGQHVAAFGWPERGAGGANENIVYVVPASGGELRRLTSAEEPGYKEGLEWHPDSRRLTYMYYGHDFRGDETRVAYLDGSPTTLLLNQPYPLWDYVGRWSPDGRTYYVVSSIRGEWGLYAHDAAAGSTREVWAESNGSAGVPEFSTDGRTLVFPVLRTTRQLWAMDLTPNQR
jgi:Tol biopolymer transport system component